jgi:allene oxide cyclase-like protein
MSRKSAAGALALVLAVSGASIASAGDDDNGGRVIRLTGKQTGLTVVENGQPGFNRGDRVVAVADVLRGDQKVGQAGIDCVFLRVEGSTATIQCTTSAELPGGQIAFQALATVTLGEARSVTAAVTGGTGRYRTAHGEASLAVSASGLTGDVTIRLS